MANNLPSLDVDYVKQFCATTLADPVIQGLIDDIDANYGQCLLSNYGDSLGSTIAAQAICWSLGAMSGESTSGNITSMSDSEGASVSFDSSTSDTDSRNAAEKLDRAGCLYSYFNRDNLIFVTLNGGSI